MTTTWTGVGWQRPAAVLAAAASGRVAVVVVGTSPRPADPEAHALLSAHVTSYLEIHDSPALRDAVGAVRAAAASHDLTLVVGASGLMIPAVPEGWTLADLAGALTAPVVIATGDGPDAANHTTLALAALKARKLAAAVVIVGNSDVDDLPLTPAGRIPPDEVPPDFRAAARSWLDPMLRANTEPDPSATPADWSRPPAGAAGQAMSSGRRAIRGRRVVLLLAGAFVSMSLVACGLAFCDRTPTGESTAEWSITRDRRSVPLPVDPYTPPPTVNPAPTRVPVSQVCPEFSGDTKPTAPDAATTNRVNAAWKRIETWLAANAPKDRKSLAPPADAESISEMQARMSVAFPPDLVASLRRHDGVTGAGFEFPFFFSPTPVKDIAREWLSTCGALADVEREDASDWWDRDYVPFATSGDGGSLFVDQRPRWGNGRVGEFYHEDGVSFDGWPPTVADLLEQTAESLETGRPFQNTYQPVIAADGTIEWKSR